MELKEVIERRHSIRKYRDKPVPEATIREMLKLAARAPSAGALRAYKIVVTEQRLTPYEAPIYLVVCALPEVSGRRYGDRGRNLYAVQDATIVASYLQLLAVERGLATVWVGAFREGAVRGALGLADDVRPIAILPLGYQDA